MKFGLTLNFAPADARISKNFCWAAAVIPAPALLDTFPPITTVELSVVHVAEAELPSLYQTVSFKMLLTSPSLKALATPEEPNKTKIATRIILRNPVANLLLSSLIPDMYMVPMTSVNSTIAVKRTGARYL